MHQSRRTVIVWDAKWWLRVLNEIFSIPASADCLYDPGLAGWLRDPDQGRPTLMDELTRLDLRLDCAQLQQLRLLGLSTGTLRLFATMTFFPVYAAVYHSSACA